jgi:hypothetical protein
VSEAVDRRLGGLCYKVALHVHVMVKWFGSDVCLGSFRDTGIELSLLNDLEASMHWPLDNISKLHS